MEEDCVDYVVVGESEDSLLELLDSIEQNEPNHAIPNVWSKKDGRVIGNLVKAS